MFFIKIYIFKDMAICRCVNHKPFGRKKDYVIEVKPIGYPNTSSVCGRKECKSKGLIWLTKDEYSNYLIGATIFSYDSGVSKVEVEKNNYK